jgi:hypothetical protein
MAHYRSLLCRAAGCEHVRRSVTGLLRSPQKTRPGLHAVPGWDDGTAPSRRALPEAVFAAAGEAAGLLPCQRALVAADQRGRRRAVLRVAWPYAPHDRGPRLWGVPAAWEQVEQRPARSHTGGTAVLAHRERLAGVAGSVPQPHRPAEAGADGQETVRASSAPMDEARGRVLARWPHRRHRQRDRKRPASARELGPQREAEGHVPHATEAFDHGVRPVAWPGCIERLGQPWGRALEGARPRPWQGRWQRVEAVAAERRRDPPDRLRSVRVRGRPGDPKPWGGVPKSSAAHARGGSVGCASMRQQTCGRRPVGC